MKRTQKIVAFLLPLLALFLIPSCLNLEEDPLLTIRPTVDLSAHIKNERITATAQINVNPDIYTAGTLPVWFAYIGEMAIYNAKTGKVIDVNTFSGGGLSKVFEVSADTASHQKLVVIAEGEIEAYADVENDGDPSNDKLISSAGFHQEAVYTLSELPSTVPE
jgi:hypothetical protein